ncbi:DUF4913 domain-containing protein [Arthrobacter subterraneus]|uniref:DUF4913 domain-containing protein n=1 Tax=Arthrobacter subterraneus TaxID=335973 RepID=UPI003CCC0349
MLLPARDVGGASDTGCRSGPPPECTYIASSFAATPRFHSLGGSSDGRVVWWLNHADPHMRVLMAPNGPLKKCTYDGHAPRPEMASLPHVDPEQSLYPS